MATLRFQQQLLIKFNCFKEIVRLEPQFLILSSVGTLPLHFKMIKLNSNEINNICRHFSIYECASQY